MSNLNEKIDELYDIYSDIKKEIRRLDPFEFERWKAGGFLIDQDIHSMYPNLADLASLSDDEDDE